MNPVRSMLARGLFAGGVLLLGACAVRADAAPDRLRHDAVVTLQRSGCFGNCPAYVVTVAADGRISFTGHAHVQTRQASGQATPAQLAAIAAALERAGLRSMRDSYVSRDDGCDTVLSDQPGISITVTDSSGSKTVDFYLGCTGAAADAVRQRIEALARSIDRQLDTARWIGQPTAPGAVEKADR